MRIFVAAHARFDGMEDLPLPYTVMQVGAAGTPRFTPVGDDTGENISLMNPYFCELTALFWMWKNADDDILGLCHYRRYLSSRPLDRRCRKRLTAPEIGEALKTHDIILPRAVSLGRRSMLRQYAAAHREGDLLLAREAIEALYPAYVASFDEAMQSHTMHQCNMLIARREVIFSYAAWLFPILHYVWEKTQTADGEPMPPRTLGYLGERLLNVFVRHNRLRVCEKWMASTSPSLSTALRALLDRMRA